MATGLRFKFSTLTNYLVVTWAANSAPLAEVGRQAYNPGSADGQAAGANELTPSSLTAEVFTFKFYDSVNGIALTTLVDSWEIDGGKTDQIAERFEYQVGRGNSGTAPNWADPADGDLVLNDQRLIGATYDNLAVEFRGIGLRSQTEFTILSGGGIQLTSIDINSGTPEKFIAPTWVFITYYQQIQRGIQSPQGIWADIKQANANVTLDTTYFNNIIDCGFSAPTGVITLPAFSSIPNLTRMLFITERCMRYAKIVFAGTDSVNLRGVSVNSITLLVGEKLELFFKSSLGYITDKYINPLIGIGFLSDNPVVPGAHLCAGGEDNIADYQRLIDSLPTEMKVSYAAYDLDSTVTVAGNSITYKMNRGKFGVDVSSGKFKWPDRRGYWMRALNFTDGSTDGTMLSQGAGGIYAQEMIQHKHELPIGFVGFNGTAPSAAAGAYNGPRTGTRDYSSTIGGSQQRVDSIGKYPMIYI